MMIELMLAAMLPLTCGTSEYENVIHPGRADGSGFWNEKAKWFMYAPAFSFGTVEGAKAYRFEALDGSGAAHRFEAERPTESLAGVWSKLPTGFVTVRCTGVDAAGTEIGLAGVRTFWKAAGFREGAYPKAAKGYRETAIGVFDYVFNMPATQYLLDNGKLDLRLPTNSYGSKMCAALINAMVRYAELKPERRERALQVARAAAKYILGLAEPADSPLAYFPPTYAGAGENNTGTRYAGQHMLIYPAYMASALVRLAMATGDDGSLATAERIASTYLKLQGEDGTWPLKMYAKDGKPVNPNRLVPIESTVPMFEALFAATGKAVYRAAADRAFAYMDRTRLADWNWEGQFEDVPPTEKYQNLTKHSACSTAIYLAERFKGNAVRMAQMRELARFAEDQFVCWEPPFAGGPIVPKATWASPTYASWQTPCALEQYNCYWPIDASAAKLIRTYLALYRAEGRPVDLAKARALGDTMTRMQDPDGRMPTWWYFARSGRKGDWINCMIASAVALGELAEFDR